MKTDANEALNLIEKHTKTLKTEYVHRIITKHYPTTIQLPTGPPHYLHYYSLHTILTPTKADTVNTTMKPPHT